MAISRRASRFANAALPLLALTLAGCSTAAVIDSDPRGATVIVDGVRGTTPFTARLPITTFGNYPIRIEMPGYEPYEGTLDEQWYHTTSMLSLAFPPAFLWSLYRPTDLTTIKLVPVKQFPEAFSHAEPWTPMLPPLPPSMVEKPSSAEASRPASSPEKR